ncbi:MAG: hypothetical protein KME06_02825 [Kastovskya adunca ATA6-11-RM4]|jgi:hypothetical protein|nr:hypothetical protein [Kastovskya adunca ATA6-11-RM4]
MASMTNPDAALATEVAIALPCLLILLYFPHFPEAIAQVWHQFLGSRDRNFLQSNNHNITLESL